MNKAFEKILERLEELQNNLLSQIEGDVDLQVGIINGVMYSIKIVQEVAEEYNNGWIPCSERLPEESLNSVIGWDEYRNRCCFVQYYGGRWILGNDIETVKTIAWQPLLPEYQPKGE